MDDLIKPRLTRTVGGHDLSQTAQKPAALAFGKIGHGLRSAPSHRSR